MRRYLFPLFCAALLTSCAYEGRVVQKDAKPHPMYLSQGIEEKYTFVLEDKAGVRHRQMVTPEVYEQYAIGQYFNDLQEAPAGTMEDSKTVKTEPTMSASRSSSHNRGIAASSSKANATTTAVAAKSTKKKHKAVVTAKKRRSPVAAEAKAPEPSKRAITIASIVPAAETKTLVAAANIGRVVTIARCR